MRTIRSLHAGDQPVRVGRLGVERLSAREGEQAVRQRRGALRRALRGGDVALEFTVAAALVDAAPQQLEAAGDAGQQVVEVVCQPAGQLAHRFHLLRLPQLFLGRHQLAGALLHLAFQRGRQCRKGLLGAAPLDGGAGPLRRVAYEVEVLRRPVAHGGVVEEQQGDEAPVLGDRDVEDRTCLDRDKHVGKRFGARILLDVFDRDGAALLQVVDVTAIVAEMMGAGDAGDTWHVPVAIDRDRLGICIESPVAGPVDAERLADDAGAGVRDLGRVGQLAEGIGKLEQGIAAPLAAHTFADVEEQHAETIARQLEGMPFVPMVPDTDLAREAIGNAGLDNATELIDPFVLDIGDHLAQRVPNGRFARHAHHPLPGRVYVDVAPIHDAAGPVANDVADQHALDEPVEYAAPVDFAGFQLLARDLDVAAVAQDLDVADVPVGVVAQLHHAAAGPEAPVLLQMPTLVVCLAVDAGQPDLFLWPALIAILGREEAVDLLAEHLVGAPAENELRPMVPVGDACGEVRGDHREVDGALENGLESRRIAGWRGRMMRVAGHASRLSRGSRSVT